MFKFEVLNWKFKNIIFIKKTYYVYLYLKHHKNFTHLFDFIYEVFNIFIVIGYLLKFKIQCF